MKPIRQQVIGVKTITIVTDDADPRAARLTIFPKMPIILTNNLIPNGYNVKQNHLPACQ